MYRVVLLVQAIRYIRGLLYSIFILVISELTSDDQSNIASSDICQPTREPDTVYIDLRDDDKNTREQRHKIATVQRILRIEQANK